MPKSGVSHADVRPWPTVTPSTPTGTVGDTTEPTPTTEQSIYRLRSAIDARGREIRSAATMQPAPMQPIFPTDPGTTPSGPGRIANVYAYRVVGTNEIFTTPAPLPRIFSPAGAWNTGASPDQCYELVWNGTDRYVFPDGGYVPHGPPVKCGGRVLLYDGVRTARSTTGTSTARAGTGHTSAGYCAACNTSHEAPHPSPQHAYPAERVQYQYQSAPVHPRTFKSRMGYCAACSTYHEAPKAWCADCGKMH